MTRASAGAARGHASLPAAGSRSCSSARSPDTQALAQLSASKPIRPQLELATAGGKVQVLERAGDLWRILLPQPALEFFERWGEVPLPPYIHRAARCQRPRALPERLRARPGRGRRADRQPAFRRRAARRARCRAASGAALVTLHVGAGTFQPLRTDDLTRGTPCTPSECEVGAAACAAIARARDRGRPGGRGRHDRGARAGGGGARGRRRGHGRRAPGARPLVAGRRGCSSRPGFASA